jgi:hypothetical protein
MAATGPRQKKKWEGIDAPEAKDRLTFDVVCSTDAWPRIIRQR